MAFSKLTNNAANTPSGLTFVGGNITLPFYAVSCTGLLSCLASSWLACFLSSPPVAWKLLHFLCPPELACGTHYYWRLSVFRPPQWSAGPGRTTGSTGPVGGGLAGLVYELFFIPQSHEELPTTDY
ncbi:unnamed protein product [Coffea canephora]|uniref:Uncharacterized protein n=1 Tax=Coffea canephora TaxID=49390 RepID=A0A068V464_COFCA|nr:unnamed protein product [Coffea canephora]